MKRLALVVWIIVPASICAAQNPAEPKFEVVSIRSTPSGGGGGGRAVVPQVLGCQKPIVRYDPGRISLNGISVYGLIAFAYAEWSNERGGCVGVSAGDYLSGGPNGFGPIYGILRPSFLKVRGIRSCPPRPRRRIRRGSLTSVPVVWALKPEECS